MYGHLVCYFTNCCMDKHHWKDAQPTNNLNTKFSNHLNFLFQSRHNSVSLFRPVWQWMNTNDQIFFSWPISLTLENCWTSSNTDNTRWNNLHTSQQNVVRKVAGTYQCHILWIHKSIMILDLPCFIIADLFIKPIKRL